MNNNVIVENSVAIHIRRTDYLKLGSIHHVLDLVYYQRAIEYIKTNVANPVFYVFSDDMNFVHENFSIENFRILNYSGKNGSLFDFLAIKRCNHHIIANSTFSWWAAWLNKNINKTIIAPKKWLAHDKDINPILPSQWIKF